MNDLCIIFLLYCSILLFLFSSVCSFFFCEKAGKQKDKNRIRAAIFFMMRILYQNFNQTKAINKYMHLT